MKTNIKFCSYSKTYRIMPQNYWLASVKNGKLIFDSWDGAAKTKFQEDIFLKFKIWIKFQLKKLKNITTGQELLTTINRN